MKLNIYIEYNEETKILFIRDGSSSGRQFDNISPEKIADYVKNYTLDCMEGWF